jgi:hypothetical protein
VYEFSQSVQPDVTVYKISVKEGNFIHVPCRILKCESTEQVSERIFSVSHSI